MPRFAPVLLLLWGAACTAPDRTAPPAPPAGGSAVAPGGSAAPDTGAALPAAVRQTVYVPVYSHIYFRDQRRTINLTATLSVRNTDARSPITIASVRYYGQNGELIRHYLTTPRRLGPMASADFVVNESDTSGGLGASFLVDWAAQTAVTQPVVEAVMISAASAQGISFVSVGRPLARP